MKAPVKSNTNRITIRLDATLKEELDVMIARKRTTMQDEIASLIRSHVEQYSHPEQQTQPQRSVTPIPRAQSYPHPVQAQPTIRTYDPDAADPDL